jgi:3-dehydroquinate synthase
VRVGTRESYEIGIGAGALRGLGVAARDSLTRHARRIAIISNRRVYGLYGARSASALSAAGFDVTHWLMGDGERYKTLRTAERALAFLSASGLERSDAVLALGGGVVGDLAGFASAIYLRGIAFIQVPTTLLAQIDSSVGGKTGVNTNAGKNLIGAFHQPRAVVIDTETLETLPPRELTAGWCEAIKQGAVGDRQLFDETHALLAAEGPSAGGERLSALIAAHCAFKARIVAGDEREEVGRTDKLSRRILNFGHTVAHALEFVTRYRRFRHGEAVGYGIVAAGEISVRLGLLDVSELELLRAAVRAAGRLPPATDLDVGEVRRALASDKKAVGGSVRWILLKELGRGRVVDDGEIPPRVISASIRAALQRPPDSHNRG